MTFLPFSCHLRPILLMSSLHFIEATLSILFFILSFHLQLHTNNDLNISLSSSLSCLTLIHHLISMTGFVLLSLKKLQPFLQEIIWHLWRQIYWVFFRAGSFWWMAHKILIKFQTLLFYLISTFLHQARRSRLQARLTILRPTLLSALLKWLLLITVTFHLHRRL